MSLLGQEDIQVLNQGEKSEIMKPLAKLLKAIFIGMIVLLFVVIIFQVAIRITNNSIAKGLEKELLACEHPTDVDVIDSMSVAGKMEGNGNGMQWFGIILVKSDMTEDMLREWYKNQLTTGENEDISVLKQETSKVFEYSPWNFKNYSDEGNYYQVRLMRYSAVGFEKSIWESILNSDLRGH